MTVTFRSQVVLAALLSLVGSVGFAQSSGQAIYKAQCLNCHGVTGMADSNVGKVMHIKPVTDPEVRKLTLDQMVTAVKNGTGKMLPYKDKLTSAQITEVTGYFHTLVK